MSEKVSRTWEKQINAEGEFLRKPTSFRGQIRADGSTEFAPESGRYHLYVSLACPWAHRTLIMRKLKGLESHITVDVVDYLLGAEGWSFTAQHDGETGDRVNSFALLREAYQQTEPQYKGAITVPLLWDKKLKRVVNNESSEIIRMFNSEFQALAAHPLDFYPTALRSRIDDINEWVYDSVNNGVYRCGFARSQAAYERAAGHLFESLDRLEKILAKNRYLLGNRLTEADIRLVTTLLRFDSVYVAHFKCNLLRLVDYENLWAYCRDIYSYPAVKETTNFEHIKRHYFESHLSINPHALVPVGPKIDWVEPHGRGVSFASTVMA